jgi:serine/threonine protein kinase/ABC-type multidrug transport system ATPase subunit
LSRFPEGYRIGPYIITRMLGEGGMGAVYEAQQEPLARRVAIKALHPTFANNQDAVARFFNEAKIISRLEHPSIVQVFDFWRAPDGAAYLVMEYLRGQSLAHLLATGDGALPTERVLQLAWQIADVLTVAHERGVIHRDLKPENLMLVADPVAPGGERAKVLDFGIAKTTHELERGNVYTHEQMVLGTPMYMSPEQCAGAGGVDAKTDVYSLGCVMYEMLSGRPPFLAMGAGQLIGMHLFKDPQPLVMLLPELEPAVAHLVHSMMIKDKTRRPSMEEVADSIEQQLAALPVSRTRPRTRSKDLMLLDTSAAGVTPVPLAPALLLVPVAGKAISEPPRSQSSPPLRSSQPEQHQQLRQQLASAERSGSNTDQITARYDDNSGAAVSSAASAARSVPQDRQRSQRMPRTALARAESLLTIEDLSARIENTTVLHHVTLALGRRGLYTLLGKAGAGKSALLGILAGRNRALSGWELSGSLIYDGAPLGSSAVRPAVVYPEQCKPVGLLQRFLMADLMDDDQSAVITPLMLQELVGRAGLASLADQLDADLDVLQLSPSACLRLSIVRELLAEPKLLCIDELPSSWSPQELQPVLQLLSAESENRTIVLATSSSLLAQKMSGHVLLLRDGHLIGQAAASQLVVEKSLASFSLVGNAEPISEASHVLRPTTDPGEPLPVISGILWKTEDPILSLRGLTMQLGAVVLLRDLNLDISATGLHVLISEDNLGKRLLLRLLSGGSGSYGSLHFQGKAYYKGRPLAEDNCPEVIKTRAQLEMIPLASYLLEPRLHGQQLSADAALNQATALLEELGFPELTSYLSQSLIGLDSLPRKLFQLLRVMTADSQLLILDELLHGLTASEAQTVVALLARCQRMRSVLLLTTDATAFAHLQPRCAWLCGGRLCGAPCEPERT